MVLGEGLLSARAWSCFLENPLAECESESSLEQGLIHVENRCELAERLRVFLMQLFSKAKMNDGAHDHESDASRIRHVNQGASGTLNYSEQVVEQADQYLAIFGRTTFRWVRSLGRNPVKLRIVDSVNAISDFCNFLAQLGDFTFDVGGGHCK